VGYFATARHPFWHSDPPRVLVLCLYQVSILVAGVVSCPRGFVSQGFDIENMYCCFRGMPALWTCGSLPVFGIVHHIASCAKPSDKLGCPLPCVDGLGLDYFSMEPSQWGWCWYLGTGICSSNICRLPHPRCGWVSSIWDPCHCCLSMDSHQDSSWKLMAVWCQVKWCVSQCCFTAVSISTLHCSIIVSSWCRSFWWPQTCIGVFCMAHVACMRSKCLVSGLLDHSLKQQWRALSPSQATWMYPLCRSWKRAVWQ